MASNLDYHYHQYRNRQLSSFYRNQKRQCLRPHLEISLISNTRVEHGPSRKDRLIHAFHAYFRFDVWVIWVHRGPFQLPIMAYKRYPSLMLRAKYLDQYGWSAYHGFVRCGPISIQCGQGGTHHWMLSPVRISLVGNKITSIHKISWDQYTNVSKSTCWNCSSPRNCSISTWWWHVLSIRSHLAEVKTGTG